MLGKFYSAKNFQIPKIFLVPPPLRYSTLQPLPGPGQAGVCPWVNSGLSFFTFLIINVMVIVSDYMEKVNATSGQTFVLLELSGGLELVQSQNTGKFYATSRKCRIPSTFSADVAKLMVGQQIEGDIVRVESDPYEYTNKTTGEIITLAHSYAYRPKGSMELLGESRLEVVDEKINQKSYKLAV